MAGLRDGSRSRLVFGTLDLPDTALAPRLLDRFYAAGGRAVDVANVYRDGESARAVGSWLRARHGPEGVGLYAKGCHPPHCRPDLVGAEVEKSLRLLGVDRLDVFVLHRDDPALPVAAFAEPLLEEVERGRIGGFGVSNWTVERLLELRDHLGGTSRRHLVAFSNHFSLAEMAEAPWPGCLAVTRQEILALGDAGVDVLTWSTLATGFFAGHDAPGWDTPANRARRDRAGELAARLGTSTPAVALAYVLQLPHHVLPVVGTRSETHLDEALAAADVELAPDEIAWLETGVEVAALRPEDVPAR